MPNKYYIDITNKNKHSLGSLILFRVQVVPGKSSRSAAITYIPSSFEAPEAS